MKVKSMFRVTTLSLLLLLLAGCSTSGELTEWAAGKANDALEVVGGGVQEVIDDLHDAEYQGGPFENNLESARAYLLEQMQEKYGCKQSSKMGQISPQSIPVPGRGFARKYTSGKVS